MDAVDGYPGTSRLDKGAYIVATCSVDNQTILLSLLGHRFGTLEFGRFKRLCCRAIADKQHDILGPVIAILVIVRSPAFNFHACQSKCGIYAVTDFREEKQIWLYLIAPGAYDSDFSCTAGAHPSDVPECDFHVPSGVALPMPSNE